MEVDLSFDAGGDALQRTAQFREYMPRRVLKIIEKSEQN
jgi:hypothetical protein